MDKERNYRLNRERGDDGHGDCQRNEGKAGKKTPDELLTEKLSEAIDLEGMGIGLVIADLFKTVSLAAVRLPSMELYSDMICVIVDDDSITVSINGLNPETDASNSPKHGKVCCRCGCEDPGYEEDGHNPYEDDEEERVYDGD